MATNLSRHKPSRHRGFTDTVEMDRPFNLDRPAHRRKCAGRTSTWASRLS